MATEYSSNTPRASQRTPGGFSHHNVQAAHFDLIARLLNTKPNRIVAIADAADLQERAEHVRDVLDALRVYLGTIVADTANSMSSGFIDRNCVANHISDLAGDLAGAIANAADDLDIVGGR